MTTSALLGHGTTFEISTNGGTSYTALAEVLDITPPAKSPDMVEATHMGSGGVREYIAGLVDPGEASFDMNFIPGSASDTLIQGIVATGDKVKCRITFPNEVTWVFDGICTGYEPKDPVADRMTASVKFKVSGSITIGTAP